jgi:thiol-disulfide isomerase/thioredoxin
MDKLFGDVILVDKQGNNVQPSSLSSKKVIGLYFSAHWCPPCRAFTPVLAESYRTITGSGKSFEVVFVSSDQSESQFKEYYAEMPWVALPFSATAAKSKLSSKYGVNGIPALILLDGSTGNVITTEGRSVINSDRNGDKFPWENFAVESPTGGCLLS